jgi:hypothetical protein
MSYVLLELKMDGIEALRSKMDTTYGQITYVLKSLTKHLMVEQNGKLSDSSIKALRDDRKRLKVLLKHAMQDFPEMLRTLHQTLKRTDENSILEMAALKINDREHDIIAYYLRMAAFMAPFWLVQIQATAVLATAVQHPELYFIEGNDLIAEYQENIQIQQKSFKEAVGTQLCDFVEALIHPTGTRSLSSVLVNLYGIGHQPVFISETPGSNMMRELVCWSGQHEDKPLHYRLQANFDCSVDNLNAGGNHSFQLFLERNGGSEKISFQDTDILLVGSEDDLNFAGEIVCLDVKDPNRELMNSGTDEADIYLTWNKQGRCFGIYAAGLGGVLITRSRASLDFDRTERTLEEMRLPDLPQSSQAKEDMLYRFFNQRQRILVAEMFATGLDWLFISSQSGGNSQRNQWWLELVEQV